MDIDDATCFFFNKPMALLTSGTRFVPGPEPGAIQPRGSTHNDII